MNEREFLNRMWDQGNFLVLGKLPTKKDVKHMKTDLQRVVSQMDFAEAELRIVASMWGLLPLTCLLMGWEFATNSVLESAYGFHSII